MDEEEWGRSNCKEHKRKDHYGLKKVREEIPWKSSLEIF